ncbi:MAG: carbamoyltransferase N-terminal domain-containing protein, partial [Flavobacteriales bacterium]
AAVSGFIDRHRADICASVQSAIVDVLVHRLVAEVQATGILTVALAGGVSANAHLRAEVQRVGQQDGWEIYIPPFAYCTDNAAMVGAAARMLYPPGDPSPWSLGSDPRLPF